MENFITIVNNLNVRKFLSDNTELIQNLYQKAEYENLRNLKQIVLDFERIFNALPDKAKSKPEILQDLLKLLMVFSIEIKRGVMIPMDISKLQEGYVSGRVSSRQSSNSITKDNSKELTLLQKMLNRYTCLNLCDSFPSKLWWQIFFDKGIVDAKELEQSILNSRYFQDENTPDWVRLWHFFDLSDNNFNSLINKVESEYSDRKYVEIGVIKHIFGLFLMFSDIGLYHKNKEEILKDSKLYIDHLKGNNQLALISPSTIDEDTWGSYGSLGYQGKEFDEFKELSSYINKVRELAREESMSGTSQDLLATMQSDGGKFYRMICLSSSQDEDVLVQTYNEVPILKHIEPTTFIEKLLLMNSEDQQRVFWALNGRYKFDSNERLIEELEWLKSVQSLLLVEVDNRKGKLSGFVLDSHIKHYLNEVLEKLEMKGAQTQLSQ